MITITQYERTEWKRFALALPMEHTVRLRLEAIAELPVGSSIGVSTFDELASHYRAWLVFGTLPESSPLVCLF